MKRPIKCGIYCIRNIVNGKRIIGSTVNIHHRFACHKNQLKNNTHHNPHLQQAWCKYGKNSFIFEIIEECLIEKLIEREDFYILQFNTMNRELGYNLTLGSRHTQNEESKEKIRQSRLGKKMSNEQKKKLSEAHTGKIRGPYSEEHKRHISESHMGVKMTPVQKQKWVESMGNRTKTQKQATIEKRLKTMDSFPIEKKLKILAQRRQAHLGIKHSEETKRKMSESHKLKWAIKKMSGN